MNRAERMMARLTAGTTMEPSTGGEPTYTNDELRGALGYAHREVPRDRLEIHLFLARATMDPFSLAVLEDSLGKLFYRKWWEYCESERHTISKQHATSIGLVLTYDFVTPGYAVWGKRNYAEAQEKSKSMIARAAKIDRGTWVKKFAKPYGRVMVDIRTMADGVADVVQTCMGEPNTGL